MKVQQLHGWAIGIPEAKQIQRELARQVSHKNEVIDPHLIAGLDISAPDCMGVAHAAVVVVSYRELEVVEVSTANGKLALPYIPGLLSFREAPLLLAACQNLSISPDLVLVDGQGIAHPRRLGLASHLGLLLDIPSIGCAKSRLCGRHEPPTPKAGSYAQLVDNDDVIGVALRTRSYVNPIYVSVGHKVNLSTAIRWVMQCCRGYRLPEPCRLAHLAASGRLIDAHQVH